CYGDPRDLHSFPTRRSSDLVIDVGNGSKVDMQARTFHLAGDFSAHFLDQVIVGDGAECHLIGIADGTVEPHAQSPFSVHRHKKRYFRRSLISVYLARLSYRTTLEEDQSAHLVVTNNFQQFLLMVF